MPVKHTFPPLETLLDGETLTIEYKEDLDEKNKQGPYSEEKLAESLMSLGNANGGYLLLGIREKKDKTGEITGVHSDRNYTAHNLCNRLLRKFVSQPAVESHQYNHQNGKVYAFYVNPAHSDPYQLQNGSLKIRKDLDKKSGPENLPLFAADLPQWKAQRGSHSDFSSRLHPDLPLSEYTKIFNPIAVAIYDRRIKEGRINNPSLSNIPQLEDQLEALGLVGTADGRKVLNNAALILFGSNQIIQERLPNHRAQFQAFGADGAVVHNLFTDKSGLEHRALLYLASRLEELYRGIIKREELMVGEQRIDIPDYGDNAVREATINAFIHRDYTKPEEVVIQLTQHEFRITNPGGFYLDVSPKNILFHEPCPRNRTLAQACADLGLAEKSGRGVDRIFWDQIRFLRPMPSYSESTTDTVRLSLLGGDGSRAAIRWMVEYFSTQEDLRVQLVHGGLIHVLMMEGESTREEMIAALPGLSQETGKTAITELINAGIITRLGHGRGQRLILSEKMQTALGQPDAFHYQATTQETLYQKAILDYVQTQGSITRKEAASLLNLPSDNNLYRRLIKPLVDGKQLQPEGTGSSTRYILNVQDTVQTTLELTSEST
jgi:ATP-dependent DNA helicase RecG